MDEKDACGVEQELLRRVREHSTVREAEKHVGFAETSLIHACKAADTDKEILDRARNLTAAWNARCRAISAVVDATFGGYEKPSG